MESRLNDGSGPDQVADGLYALAAVDFGSIPDQVATILEGERKARKAIKQPTAKGIAP